LLRVSEPEQRAVPCRCGGQARYRELRSKTVLTVGALGDAPSGSQSPELGSATVSRPYFLCLDWGFRTKSNTIPG